MKINRNNYESYFIDYLDGTLSTDNIDLLLDFLHENPDLAEELKGLEKIKFYAVNEKSPDFLSLKKTDLDHPDIFEETCIRAVEKELNDNELIDFKNYISLHEKKRKEYELFCATLLQPDLSVRFEKKTRLKKKDRLIPYYWYAVAAIVILGLFVFLPREPQPVIIPVQQMAESTVTKTPVKVNSEVKKTAVKADKIVPRQANVTKPVKDQVILADMVRPVWNLEPMASRASLVQPTKEYEEIYALKSFETGENKLKDYSKYITVEQFLSQKTDELKAKEKKGLLGKFALNSLKKISGEKFNYSTGGNGKIDKLEYNSKLLAFTIPLGQTN